MTESQTKLISVSSNLQTQTISSMESALCPSFPRPSTVLLNGPSTMNVQRRAIKLGSGRSISLWLSTGSHRRPLGHAIISPVNCAFDKPSTPLKKEKGENKVVKGALRASMVLACALGIISCSCTMKPKAIALGPIEMHQKAPPSMSTYQFGASKALHSFLDVSIKLASRESTPSYNLPNVPRSVAEVDAVKTKAVQLMKLGKPDEAVKQLQDIYEGHKAREEAELAYHVEMVLVEILICLGRYEEAFNCSCLEDKQRIPFDGRFPLYKAIICTMLNKEEARIWWEQFLETVGGDIDPTM